MLTVGGVDVAKYIESPVITHRFRARSVVYTLNGTANEDRLGNAKKMLTLPFALIPADTWEQLRTAMMQNTISVSGSVGSCSVSGTYRLFGNDIPTPILVVQDNNYVTQKFSVTLEEI